MLYFSKGYFDNINYRQKMLHNSSPESKFINHHKKQRSTAWLTFSFVIFTLFIFAIYYGFTLQKNRQEILIKLSKSSTKRQTSISKNTPQVIPENVLNSSLYYLHNGYLYRKIGLLSPPEILFKADSYDVSKDNSKIVYSFYPEVDPYKDEKPKVYIYEVNTKKKIEVKLSDYDRLRGLEFSSNGEYLVVDYGSSANGEMKIYNLRNEKLIGSISDGFIVWLDDKSFLIGNSDDRIKNRPWEAGYGYSITKVNLDGFKETDLLRATSTEDYHLYPQKFDDCILVSKTFVDKESDWQKSDIYSERKSELGCIDNDGNISKAPEQNIVKLKESLAKKLTDKINFDTHEQKYKVYENDIYINLKLNSFIFRFNKKSSVYDADIYLTSIDNPENDWILLGQGADIVWK